MLAARMLSGEYNPFQLHDIFSGRILLIASQAAIYKIAGINPLSTQSGSLIMAILSCYFIVFKLLPIKNGVNTFVATYLFYFNPVLTYSTIGIEGDIYVLLMGIFICMALKSWVLNKKTKRGNIVTGTFVAFVIALSLLYKETILVFLPFVCVVAFLYDKVNAKPLIVSALVVFSVIILLYAGLYYYFTGNTFFRVAQIQNSSYFNRCSYHLLPFKYLIIRLTYGVWQEFIVQGFYPVIFGAFIAALLMYKRTGSFLANNLFPVFFAVLLIVCFYFPFSLNAYEPLCSDTRQFLSLLPLGVIVSTDFLCNMVEIKNVKSKFILFTLAILLVCIESTGNKWQWMIYIFISVSAIILIISRRLPALLTYTALFAILWLSILEHLFFQNSPWFRDMTVLDKRVSSKYFYFADHDNMMHWQLLHHFDNKTFAFYNLQKDPFKIFKLYYQDINLQPFHAGWLVINKKSTVRSPVFLQRIDSLKNSNYFIKQVIVGDMSAFLIDNPAKLAYVHSIIRLD